jgi:hypothetical protein
LLLDPCTNKVNCSESVLFNEKITGSGEPFNSFEWKAEEDLSVVSLLENPDCTPESSVLIENKLPHIGRRVDKQIPEDIPSLRLFCPRPLRGLHPPIHTSYAHENVDVTGRLF